MESTGIIREVEGRAYLDATRKLNLLNRICDSAFGRRESFRIKPWSI